MTAPLRFPPIQAGGGPPPINIFYVSDPGRPHYPTELSIIDVQELYQRANVRGPNVVSIEVK